MHISELETPALLVDLDILKRNLCRVAEYAKAHDLGLRPHTKTHKSNVIARRQLALGAIGLTVAKVGEAEVLATSQPPELLVAYPVLGRSKLERLMRVAADVPVTVALDSVQAARQLSDAARLAQMEIGVLAEVDVGLGRVGVAPSDLVALAQTIDRLPRLNLRGFTFYPGHIKDLKDEEGQKDLRDLNELLQQILADWKRSGLNTEVISGGSTPTLFESHRVHGMTEIRPGTYVFNDKNTWHAAACGLQDCAASVLTTVVSTAKNGQIIVDGGSKTFSSDRLVGSSEVSFGFVMDAPEAVFGKMNEEHGYIDVRRVNQEFSVGDRVRIIPNHVCVVMNLHEKVYGIQGNEVVETWHVEARGKLQ